MIYEQAAAVHTAVMSECALVLTFERAPNVTTFTAAADH